MALDVAVGVAVVGFVAPTDLVPIGAAGLDAVFVDEVPDDLFEVDAAGGEVGAGEGFLARAVTRLGMCVQVPAWVFSRIHTLAGVRSDTGQLLTESRRTSVLRFPVKLDGLADRADFILDQHQTKTGITIRDEAYTVGVIRLLEASGAKGAPDHPGLRPVPRLRFCAHGASYPTARKRRHGCGPAYSERQPIEPKTMATRIAADKISDPSSSNSG